jgi:tetratricopeptide (TPR) repeat protein
VKLAFIAMMALALAALPAVAHAQTAPTAEQRAAAKQHYQNGARKFDVGKYDDAAAEWEAAYELVGDPSILYNIAQALRAGGKNERALRFFKNYLRHDESNANRDEVERRIAELNAIIEQQKKNAPPPEPTPTPVPPQPVVPTPTPGPVVVAPAPEPPPPKKPLPKSLKYVGYGLVGLAAASLATGAAMSALASSASSDVQKAAANHDVFDAGLQSKESNGKTYDTVAIAGYVAAGVFAAAGVTLIVITKRSEKNVSIAPSASAHDVGLVVSGSF